MYRIAQVWNVGSLTASARPAHCFRPRTPSSRFVEGPWARPSEAAAARREPEPEHAIDWIAKTLSAQADTVTLVPTGPLTNVALFLARYPELECKVEWDLSRGRTLRQPVGHDRLAA